MKIGIDLGTSYSSAGVFREGRIDHVLFNGESQFRTSVFFPNRAVDFSSFRLTALHEQEISDSIHSRNPRSQGNFLNIEEICQRSKCELEQQLAYTNR